MTKSTGKYAPRGGSLAEQFFHSVSPEPTSGCWLWNGTVTQHGYGTMTREGRTLRAHKVSYEMHCGPITPGMHVLHKCDVRCCVNPEHLFLGRNEDNVADKVAKGRQAKGERFGHAKLTDDLVRAMRAEPGSTREVARKYGVGKSTAASVMAGKLWTHVV